MGVTINSVEIEALVSLLADDDSKIVSMVREHLLRLGSDAVPSLKVASEHTDPRLRIRVRHVLQRILQEELEREFREMASQPDDEFDLERACLVVARHEYPELSAADLSRPLDEIADRIRPQLQGVGEPKDQIRVLHQVLFEEYRFRGNSRDYYDPDNALLNRVLERRKGVPVTLATVYLLVAKRLGLPFFGVGLPSSFLVRYGDGETDLFIDPFLDGKLLGKRDCVQYLTSAGYYYRDAYISNSSSRDIVVRTLRHLVVAFSKRHDKMRMNRLTRFADLIQSRESAR